MRRTVLAWLLWAMATVSAAAATPVLSTPPMAGSSATPPATASTASTPAAADADPLASTPLASTDTDRVYAQTRPSLLQVRTLVKSADRQSTLGSGFLVTADGLIITNYHVVSQYALEPSTYRLEYAAPDGSSGALTLLAIDIANDLAVVRMDRQNLPYLSFDDGTLHGDLPKGERLYSMGNPLDLGFTIVEGTYNGGVEHSYSERIHFTGAINPGMSGGPVVTIRDRVVGINVSHEMGGELVSFLVPARFAVALLARARSGPPLDIKNARDEIGRQLAARQAVLYAALGKDGFHTSAIGPYNAPESAAPWFTCWARTNIDTVPKPRGQVDTTRCHADTSLFVADDMQTGSIDLSHAYARSTELNAFQFANFLSTSYSPLHQPGPWTAKRLTTPRCNEDFIDAAPTDNRPLLHAVWCARAYRDFPGLYDVVLTAVTQDRSAAALSVQMTMQSVTYDAALAYGKSYLEALSWVR